MKRTFLRVLAVSMAAMLCLPLAVSCGSGSGREQPADSGSLPADTDAGTAAKPADEPASYPSLEGKKPFLQDGAYTLRNLSYGDRVDLSDSVKAASSQVYDLYLPAQPGEIPADAPVFLYVHGGGWSDANYTKNTDAVNVLRSLAASGMVVFTMNYILTGSQDTGDSVEDMLDDIDAMLTHMKTVLKELCVKADKVGIGGTSAGGHLSALYAFSRGEKAPIRIGFEADVVGPVDLLSFKPMIDGYMTAAGGFEAFRQATGGSFTEIFCGLAGRKTLTEAELPAFWEEMRALSATTYVTDTSCPAILLYGLKDYTPGDTLPPEMKSDGMVPYTNCEKLTELLTQHGVPFTAKTFEGHGHGDFPWMSPIDAWFKEQVLAYAELYL